LPLPTSTNSDHAYRWQSSFVMSDAKGAISPALISMDFRDRDL